MKRFYKDVGYYQFQDSNIDNQHPSNIFYKLILDGKIVKIPDSKIQPALPILIPSEHLAKMICDEWQRISDEIDFLQMPITRIAIAGSNIHHLGAKQKNLWLETQTQQLCDYINSDLICYYALEPIELTNKQQASWQNIHNHIKNISNAELLTTNGIEPLNQAAKIHDVIKNIINQMSIWQIVAVSNITKLSGSIFIAIAIYNNAISAQQAAQAATIEEEWQLAKWGEDKELRDNIVQKHQEIHNLSSWLQNL